MFEYFYHEIMRRTIIGFGSLFNNIKIEHTNETDTTISTLKVPLAYGPTQKFLARLEQQADLSKSVQISLPRMSFEMTGLNYDPSRKSTTTQTFLSPVASDKKKIAKTYLPVPYNLDFELSIFTKLNDDMLQVIVLTSITTNDDYEGDFSTRRALIYTIRFTAKTYFYGPVQTDTSKDIIKKVTVGYVAGGRTPAPSREMSYSVVPRATRAYNDTPVTTLGEDVDATETIITVADASSITKDTYIYIDNEEIYVESIQNNDLTVRRAQDGSTAAIHVLGTGVKNITAADNELIEFGDNFGFDGF